MKFFLLFIISLNVFAKTPYQLLEEKHDKAVKLWENGKNQEAFSIFRENKLKNHTPSIFYLGLYYLYGFNTVTISYDKAFQYINSSAEKGYIDAILQKAILYYYGIGIMKDRVMSRRIVNKISPYISILEEKSLSYMLILMKFKYKFNSYRFKARKRLIKKLNKSRKKNENRLIRVNMIFFYRTLPKFLRLFKKANKLIELEIKHGNAEAEALYYEQYSRKRNAFKRLLSAGKQGDMNSQFNLYLLYGRRKNRKSELKWLKKAAKSGDKTAQKILRHKRR